MSTKDLRENTVWEDAGVEFYQENYKGHRSNSTVNRIPLPSQTARRNSGWKTGTGAYTARRGTTGVGTGIDYNIVDGIPDLADESIGNERSCYEQLKSFKRMPISMAEKRGLKSQLQANPVLKLMGWAGLKWRLQRGISHFANLRKHFNFTLFASQLRSIECRAGFAFVTFFHEMKKLLILNLLTAVVYALYLSYPFIVDSVAFYSQMNSTDTESTNNATTNQDGSTIPVFEWQNVTQILLNKRSFIFYSFDNATPKLILTLILVYYALSVASCFANTWNCLKEKIERKYIQNSCCDLIFSGWHYFTRCKSGAEFKRISVQREIQAFLQDIDSIHQNQLGLFGIRTCVNVINLMLMSVSTLLLWHIQEFSYEFYWESDKYEQLESIRFAIYFLPQIFIVTTWMLLSCIVERMGKWEKYPHKTQVLALVLRCWGLRLLLLACFITKFHSLSYFEREVTPVRVDDEAAEESCWETHFAKEIYKFLVVDISMKTFLTFVLEPIRVLMGKLCTVFGAVHFHCVSNFLDIICIQGLAWIGIYFAPMLPLAMSLYLLTLFLVKSFSLQANVKGAPDIFRPMEALIVKVKMATLALSATALLYVFCFMRPSSTCGPFQDYPTPWEYIKESIRDYLAHEVVGHLKCPQWSLPLMVLLLCICIYYKCVIRNGEKMIDTLKHLLVLEGHDKQFLFRRVEAMQGGTSTTTIDN